MKKKQEKPFQVTFVTPTRVGVTRVGLQPDVTSYHNASFKRTLMTVLSNIND